MPSERNTPLTQSTTERLLTAARECVLAVGWKRTTLTDVARRAGVSRMTVYRSYPDMSTLFADLMTQETTDTVARILADLDDSLAGPDRIATGIARTVAALRSNELYLRVVDLDPDFLLPYLLQRRGRSQDAVLEFIVTELDRAQADGTIRPDDPALLARVILLAAQGHAVSIATITDGFSADELDDELVTLIRRYLAP